MKYFSLETWKSNKKRIVETNDQELQAHLCSADLGVFVYAYINEQGKPAFDVFLSLGREGNMQRIGIYTREDIHKNLLKAEKERR